eukprot:CAMPEP_0197708868 /NCGR_PEP_ID=MMETSP1338-20131121/128170_1 /TAXON_ID=43686 ORGANISM="Pelagodinium beii, Strain RCC1491" /NCGR_SAMPLE_ID=MMETSP1338 /ASSEMBLY_ACC=CAM_ASM_000754 /LENGTH=530 /DNA_ID=CAMNT_0043292799 /DNA_START=60 /DNA_END=1652 /DNA_ORIENTATION=-
MSAAQINAAETKAASQDSNRAFMQLCLGEKIPEDLALADLEEDFFAVDEEDEQAPTDPTGPTQFAMGDDSDGEFDAVAEGSDSDVDDEIEDAYNFDPDMVADLLKKRGCTMAELTEKFQESMAQALERRLKEKTEPEENPYNWEESPECTGDVDGLMTPEETKASPVGSPDAKTVAEKLEQAKQEAIARKGRRSSAVKRDAISAAMDQAVSRHRKSLVSFAAQVEESGDKTKENISQAMSSAQRRHRLSISKAAETLDAAGFGDHDEAEVQDKLSMVQKAMEEARKRHRRSIAEAVEKVTGMSAAAAPFMPPSSLKKDAAEFNPQSAVQDRIQEAIAAAHQRKQHESCPPGYEGSGTAMGSWNQAPSYDESSYNQNSYQQSGYEQASCTNTCYVQSGYEQTSYNQTGYHQTGYHQTGCDQTGYDQTGYNQTGYDQTGYNQTGYDQTGCNQMSYAQNSYDQSSMQAGNVQGSEWGMQAGQEVWDVNGNNCGNGFQDYSHGADWNQGKYGAWAGQYPEGSACSVQQAAWGSA